jgi:cytochrome P450
VKRCSRARSRVTAWLGRKYLARLGRKGASGAFLLPDELLALLRRNELDPVEELALMSAQAPVTRLSLPFGLDAWVVTGYQEVRQVLGAGGSAYSNDFRHLVANTGVGSGQQVGGLGFTDPPYHTRLRHILTPEFTMRRLSRLAPRIQAIVEGRLDAIAAAEGPVDLVTSFALPIPALTICELLGIPEEDRHDFETLSAARFDLLSGAGASLGAITESLSVMTDIVRKQRRDPGDGLIGMIIREHGDTVDDEELAGLADGVLTGGFETTASMLALGALVLLNEPASAELLRRDDDAVSPFVEEQLRRLTVVQMAFPRFAREDVVVAGERIPKGGLVLCSLSAANRDHPDAPTGAPTADATGPESGGPARRPAPHLAFGYGIHRCVGAELARMELRAAYPALVRRFPHMRLAVDPSELAFRQLSIVYGLDALPVQPGPAAGHWGRVGVGTAGAGETCPV